MNPKHRRYQRDRATGRWIDTRTGELLPGPDRRPTARGTAAHILFGSAEHSPNTPRDSRAEKLIGGLLAQLFVALIYALIYLLGDFNR